RGGGVRADERYAAALEEVDRAVHDGGVDDARDDVDLVLLDELVGGRLAAVRGLALVGEDHLDVAPAELVALLLDVLLEAGLHVVAERLVDAGLRDEQADADRAGA